ncbi:MAG: S41 family peptidase [Chloroflexi bacterium]|nr:S41 family peptidase [Chloroflexota bacterium]
MKKTEIFHLPAPIVTILLIVVWFCIGWVASTLYQRMTDPSRGMIATVIGNIQAKAYAETSRQELTYNAIKSILSSLGDRYAEFRDPVLASRNSQELEGDGTAAIGVKGEMQNGQFVLTEIIPALPADLNGLKPGDIITSIDGWTIPADCTSNDVLLMLRNKDVPVAHLEVSRSGSQMSLDIPRQPVESVQSKVLDHQIGYLRFDLIGQDTPGMIKTEIEKLQSKNIQGLIIDLRYNGGGWMEATLKIIDLFEAEGIAYFARLRDGTEISYPTSSGDIAEKIPLVVLISHATYSASETMAASLKDRGRAVLVGETTHGKGSIVENISLADGSEIVFTVARWISPVNKTDYEGIGVPPDIDIADNSNSGKDGVLDAAVDYLLSHRQGS